MVGLERVAEKVSVSLLEIVDSVSEKSRSSSVGMLLTDGEERSPKQPSRS